MTSILFKQGRDGSGRGPMTKLRDIFRSARSREADAIVARYAGGRLSDSAEREMTEKLLHLGDTFRF